MSKPTVVFDFDGVIHSYITGWRGVDVIPDPPVPGIAESIKSFRDNGYNVVVVSTRCNYISGKRAIMQYLLKYDIEVDDIRAEKPPAICYIDDRAICFDGHPETLLNKVQNFKSWNR